MMHLVDIVAAEVGVAVGGQHLEDVVADIEDGDVERAAAEIEDGDLFIFLLLKAVGQGGRGRLVDDPLDLEAGDLAGLLGRLALGVVEVGRNGDDGPFDLFAQVILGGPLQVLQDHGGDLRRGVELAADVHLDQFVGVADDLVGDHLFLFPDFAVPPAHEPLDRVDGVLRVGDHLAFGQFADQPLALFP